jgi:seryl-tRNA synthetase
MIDLKALREDPERFRLGAARKRIGVEIDRILDLDARRRELTVARDEARAEQKRIEKELGKEIGRLSGGLKKAKGAEHEAIQRELEAIKQRPAALKLKVQEAEEALAAVEPELDALLLHVPQPPDDDVPVGESADDNVEIRRWNPEGFDPEAGFAASRGFRARSHVELMRALDLVDFERAVKISGSRSYVLKGAGMRLHLAVLRYAFDFMVNEQGFTPVTAPVLVREEMMTGTGFFPAGREQSYSIDESRRSDPDGERQVGDLSHRDLFLAGTGEVGLMGLRAGEILDEAELPLRYVTWSDCFRREAGAAGKDTAGLYRIHHFQKVEQVVIGRADEAESRAWHAKMIGSVETILQRLGLPYRLLQCCTADLGPKNADMIDIECWMPSRGDVVGGVATGAYGETHSASRLYDYQCRRLNMRYREGGEGGKGATTFCHSLNNTVVASPRILIPLVEMYQEEDGSIGVPEVLRGYMGGVERID